MTTVEERVRISKLQWAGLTLWRSGILLVGAYFAYWAIRGALRIADAQLELAVAIFAAGLLMVFGSLVMERIEDARNDGKEEL